MPFSDSLLRKAQRVLDLCGKQGKHLAVAESCTGGLLAACFTELAGASSVFLGGAVTYANEAKHEVLGVSMDDISAFGAVSEQVAREMARGACQQFHAQVAAATTGIAGPSGGSPEKPVGTVDIAICIAGDITYKRHHFNGDRRNIRVQSVEAALDMLLEGLGDSAVA